MRPRWVILPALVGLCAGCAVVQVRRDAVVRLASADLKAIQATTFATLVGLGYGPGTRMRKDGGKTFEVPRDSPRFTYESYRPANRSALLGGLRVSYAGGPGGSGGPLAEVTIAWEEVGPAPTAIEEAERRLREIGERLRAAFQARGVAPEVDYRRKETVLRFEW
jgi:hypothetical protein